MSSVCQIDHDPPQQHSLLTIIPNPCFASHIFNFLSWFLLPFDLSDVMFVAFFLNICARNFNCLFFGNLSITDSFISFFPKTPSRSSEFFAPNFHYFSPQACHCFSLLLSPSIVGKYARKGRSANVIISILL